MVGRTKAGALLGGGARYSSIIPRKLRDPVKREAKNCPVFVGPGTQLSIKLDRRLIPIEHRPLHAPALALASNLREANKKSAAVAFATNLWPNEKILEIKPAPPHPGREVVEEKRKANRLAAFLAKQNLRGGMQAEKTFAQLILGRHHFVRCAFVLRQFAD